MLSLLDLLDAGSVDLPMAAYLAAAMRSGASALVGARPGGAGKTAVMCALINFVPSGTRIVPVGSPAVLAAAGDAAAHPARHDGRASPICYLAHEVGSGPYYAYIWGAQARAFFRLARKGHIVATNLHADTLQETRHQLCVENGVPEADLGAVTLKVYLGYERVRNWSARRWLCRVYESDGTHDRLLWTGAREGTFRREGESSLVRPAEEHAYAELLERLQRHGTRRIRDVRLALTQQG
jgi:hypothetical protein